jgi:hypothetical protein
MSFSDRIDTLQTDQTAPSHAEIQIVNSLFKEKIGTVKRIMNGTKDVLIMGVIYVLMMLPQIDSLIKKVLPVSATSVYILILVKAIIFMLMYFIVKNIYLVRK